jgi:hypothetical protein
MQRTDDAESGEHDAGLDGSAALGGAADAAARLDAAEPPEPPPPQPASYAAVVEILQTSCSYVRCHAGSLIGGSLPLVRGTNLAATLVGVPACEYEKMNRIEPYDPEHSWVMVKLTASFRPRNDPYENYIYFDPEPGWDPDQRGCRDHTDDGQPLFGCRMPLTAPNMLPPEQIETIRHWIMDGAPHDP